MKKTAMLLCALLGMPLVASAVSVDVSVPGVSFHVGDRDHRGNYWDGYGWRTPGWWREHWDHRHGERGPHGYWNGRGWGPGPAHHAPPPPPRPPHRDWHHDRHHDDHHDHHWDHH